jgi:Fe/S biogenesis protein NfuA
MTIVVTDNAKTHLKALLEKEASPDLNLRVFVSNPGTPQADMGLSFCLPEEKSAEDESLDCGSFTLFIDKEAVAPLREARIDFIEDELGGQLSIHAPYLKGKPLSSDRPLLERINHVLETEINPSLAGHGGRVSLVDILEEGIVVLRFGGGCHGCGMANVTLKQGIEKTLKAQFPEIVEVRDATDHATGQNPYY